MDEGTQSSTSALPSINTYHCLCTTLVLTTTHDLESLPRRAEPVQDGALILPPSVNLMATEGMVQGSSSPSPSALVNTIADRKPMIIRRDDGFEKRTLLRCARCKLVIGYSLDEAHFENPAQSTRPVYLLPGGMLSTADMADGKSAGTPLWAEKSGE